MALRLITVMLIMVSSSPSSLSLPLKKEVKELTTLESVLTNRMVGQKAAFKLLLIVDEQ